MLKKHRCLSVGILFADVGCSPITHCPVPGELVQTDRIELTLGGCASNVALNLAKLDVSVGLCGCVGDDAFSDFVIRSLEHPLIDTDGVRRIKNSGPGCSLIVNVQGQDRRFVSTTGANAAFSVAKIPENWVQEAEVLYIGGYLMMPHLEEKETIAFLKNFQDRGGKTILDVVIYGDRPYWNVIQPLLPYVDYFIPNNDEGRLICGLDDPVDQAKFFLDAGVQTAIITCGEFGSVYYSSTHQFRTNVFPVDFVGGTGSGDAFAAGFIAALLENAEPTELMNRASAQGMSCVRDSSATKSVFTKKELQEFVANNQLQIMPIR